jgi:hypothetical protein
MNIPINFDKIDGVKFKINENDFYIEVDSTELGDIWIYSDNRKYNPLLFDIDWRKETYALIKCLPGNGRSGTVLATDAVLVPHLMKALGLFINHFIKDILKTLIKNNLI